MRICPKCSYSNGDGAAVCGICAASLRGVARSAPPPPPQTKFPGRLLAAGLALLAAAGYIYFRGLNPAPAPAVTEEDGFDYEGVRLSLGAMRDLRFLPAGDKLKVRALLTSPDENTAFQAAELIGAWSRFSAEPELKKELFEALLDCSLSCGPASRRQAALEAGLTAAFGLRTDVYAGKIKNSASALIRDKAEQANAAGFFLASMCGDADFVPEMRTALSAAPSPYLKLHAACALSRLGLDEGHGYLFTLIPSVSGEDAAGAVACLAYSASPRAGEFLRKTASGVFGKGKADAARDSLALRAQIAKFKQ